MMITPAELRNRSFSKEFRGYNVNEVDDYIATVLENYEELYRENSELEKKLRLVAEKLEKIKSDEETIRSTIINAQKVAESIIADAGQKAKEITGAINESCEEILADYRKRIIIETEVFCDIRDQVENLKHRLFDVYRGHIESIKEKFDIEDIEKTEEEFISEALLRAKTKMEKREQENQIDNTLKENSNSEISNLKNDDSTKDDNQIRPDFDAFESAKNNQKNK